MTAQEIADGLLGRYRTNRALGLDKIDLLDPAPETLPALDYQLAIVSLCMQSDRALGVFDELDAPAPTLSEPGA